MVELDELVNQIDVGAIMSLKLKRIELLITEKENERDKHQDTSMKLYDSYVEELISREEDVFRIGLPTQWCWLPNRMYTYRSQ